MTYALVNLDPLEIVQRWGAVPGRVDFGGNTTVSPANVGDEHNGRRIVEVTHVGRNAPSRFHTHTGETLELDGNALTVTHSWEQTSSPTAGDVKAAARERILARYPEWKQMNLTARAVELSDAKQTRDLSQAEEAEESAIKSVWAWVKSVREASDAIEALDPIPLDYNSDQRWPA